jgi:hypothetical protein
MKIFLLFLLSSVQQLLGAVILFQPPEALFTADEIVSSAFAIDIDNNGTDDFQFGGSVIRGSVFRTERANRMVAIPASPPNVGGSAVPILPGVEVGSILPTGAVWLSSSVDGFTEPEALDGTFSLLVLCVSTGCEGLFYSPGGLRAMLGVEFLAEDGLHYGYFDLEYEPGGVNARIWGWAYESEANTTIVTALIPEPSWWLLVVPMTILGITRRSRATDGVPVFSERQGSCRAD